MGFFVHWLVVKLKTKPVPPLLYFGVHRIGKVVVFVNLGQSILFHVAPVLPQFIQEKQFCILWERVEFLESLWGLSPLKLIVYFCQRLGLIGLSCWKVKCCWESATCVEPFIPFQLAHNLNFRFSFISKFSWNEFLKCIWEILRSYWFFFILLYEILHELLECRFACYSFQLM